MISQGLKLTLSMIPTVIITILFLWDSSNAQYIALRAGVDAIPTSSNDQPHDGNLPKGFHVGLMGNLLTSSKMHLRPGIQYTWLNYYSRTRVPEDRFVQAISEEFQLPPDQARQLISAYRKKTETTTSYIFFPLQLSYHLSAPLNIVMGPQVGFILHNKDQNNISATVAGQPIQDRTKVTTTDGMRNMQVALSTGIEYQLSNITNLELQYSRSLSTLEDDDSNTNSYYNFIQFSIVLFLL